MTIFENESLIAKAIKLEQAELKLEECKFTSIEDIVIELCIKSGFIEQQDKNTKSSKISWVKEIVDIYLNVIALENVIANKAPIQLTIDTVDKIIQEKQNTAKEIIGVIAKELGKSLPSYII